MEGPKIIASSLSATVISDKFGNDWQYHPRSDRHSKIACWAILFDLLLTSEPIRRDAEAGKLSFGINHTMHDFKHNRKKDLDLVLCKSAEPNNPGISFSKFGEKCGVVLDDAQKALLAGLPPLNEGPVGPVLMALEAKACMTAHIKALPRLYDELSSSQITVHGDTSAAISVGFVMVNVATRFLSPLLNQRKMGERTLEGTFNPHRQPSDALRVIQKVKQLPRSAHDGDPGYDALGITLVEAVNDGSGIQLVEGKAPYPIDEIFTYDFMIKRSAHWYATRFGRI